MNYANKKLLVSIIINNYNYSRFLREAIDSALNQTHSHVEVIVVDDGSTDGSQEIIISYGERVIPVLKENGGQASAFNAGFAACRGDIIFFLDSDDVFYANKVEQISDILITKMVNSPCVMVYHLLECVDKNGASLGCRIPGSLYNVPANLYQYACQYKFFPYAAAPTSGIAMSRELGTRIFPIPEKGVRTSADEFIVRPALLLGDVYGVDSVLSRYRIHGGNNWYGERKIKTKEFAVLLEEFLNIKLKENNKTPVISFFDSMYARNYYMLHGSSKDLFRLLLNSLTWGINFRNIRFVLKTTFFAIGLHFKEVKNELRGIKNSS
jgi:glycosyltransferase involved in cell wall biosynthesis